MRNSLHTEPEVKIRLRVRWVPFLAMILFLVQQFFPGRVQMTLSLILGAVWLLSYYWARSLASGVRLDRESRYGWSQVGDVFEEKVTLRNDGLFPAVWLLIRDRSTLIGHSISVGTGIEGKSSRRWTKRTVCGQRGEYQLGPTELDLGDPFGLYQVKIKYEQYQTFVVSPPVIPLPMQIRISSGRAMHDHSFANRHTEKSTVSINTRLFAPGDTLLRVHWLTTARLDEPHVRQYENIHASNTCWLILDLDKSVHALNGDNDSLENGIITAVSLADRFLKDGLAVGLLAEGDRFLMLPPGKGVGQLRQIQRSLAIIEGGGEPLEQVMLRSWPRLLDENNLVVITPSKSADWLDPLFQLRRSYVHPSVFILKSEQEAEGEAEQFGSLLSRYGIKHYIISPELFQIPESTPGKKGVVQWRFTPMGRAIKVMLEDQA
jgi:uncharacterized protein (DUF58 family)